MPLKWSSRCKRGIHFSQPIVKQGNSWQQAVVGAKEVVWLTRSQGKWWRMAPGTITGLSRTSAPWGFLTGTARTHIAQEIKKVYKPSTASSYFTSCPWCSSLSTTATTSVVSSPSSFLLRALLGHSTNVAAGCAHAIPLKVAYLV